MKILHLIDTFDARFDRDQTKLVELLEKRGHHNTVITSRYSSDWRFMKKTEFDGWEKRFSETKIIHAPSLEIPTLFSKLPLHVYLPSRQILSDFDIIQTYTCGTYSSFLGVASKVIEKSRVVMRSDLSSATYHKAKNALFYRTIITYPFKTADMIYAYSNLEKRYLTGLGVQEDKIWVIPVGIDLSQFSKNSREQKGESVTIGYLGRFSFVKGIHRVIPTLCKILGKEKGVRVIFTGILEDVDYGNKAIAPLKKFSNFEYRGDLSTSPLLFYDMCEITLVPSLSETGAITVLEAMASGKAVIASNINPINEYIEHEHTGFLFNNQEEVYLYLKKLLESPNLIREIGRRARKEAAKYDWSRIIHRYEEMYRSVIK